MWEKIVAFFMSIITFFMSLFGLGSINSYEYRDVAYGTHERQVLDLNIPKETDGEIGLVLFIHGGAWIAGDKSSYENGVRSAADTYGYAAASINYRYISDTVSFADILDDIDAALARIKEIGIENGVNINKVLLTGDSAGGHLSLLYAYSRAETAPITPAAVVSNSGPTDLYDNNFYINNALGDAEVLAGLFSDGCGKEFTYAERESVKQELMEASPVYYVNENTVPTIICHGMKDTIVPYSNAVTLDARLTECGVTHDFVSYPNSGHGLESDEEQAKYAEELMFEYLRNYVLN